jgi:poly(3-hydroxybutyrate) depolymerase
VLEEVRAGKRRVFISGYTGGVVQTRMPGSHARDQALIAIVTSSEGARAVDCQYSFPGWVVDYV